MPYKIRSQACYQTTSGWETEILWQYGVSYQLSQAIFNKSVQPGAQKVPQRYILCPILYIM